MNWKQIAEACPKAWDEFCRKNPQYGIYGGKLLQRNGYPYKNRDLYDHFDALGMYCLVRRDDRTELWNHSVVCPNPYPDHNDYSTRIEAESAAFTRAFALREGQLNNE